MIKKDIIGAYYYYKNGKISIPYGFYCICEERRKIFRQIRCRFLEAKQNSMGLVCLNINNRVRNINLENIRSK